MIDDEVRATDDEVGEVILTDDAERAVRFRSAAAEQGLILVAPDEEEPRFTFRLTHGELTTARDPATLLRLLHLAKECWGEDGDYDELQCAMTPLHRVLPTIVSTVVVWSLDVTDGNSDVVWSLDEVDVGSEEAKGIQLIEWLRYHAVLPQVGQQADLP